MNVWILRLLRQDARRWWYHALLRERGQLAEARKRERNGMLSTVRVIRQAVTHGVECVYVEPGYGAECVTFPRVPNASSCTAAVSGLHPGDAQVWLTLAQRNGWTIKTR